MLRLNMDETNLRRSHDTRRGLLMTKRPPRVPVLLSNETPTRGSFSHVTFICDDPTVQPLLPQVILGNEHVLRKQDLDAVAATLPRNVYLIRGKSSWLDHPVLCAILKWLGRALLHLQTSHEVLLLWDCCSVHLHTSVLRAAHRAGIRLCFIPRKTTWLLQPCDTHVFRRYKSFVRREYQRIQLQQQSPVVSTQSLISIFVAVVRRLLQGHQWSQAFSDNGYVLGQNSLCARIRDILPEVVVPQEHEQPVTLAEVVHVLPRRRGVPSDLLWARRPAQPPQNVIGENTDAMPATDTAATPPLSPAPEDEHMFVNTDEHTLYEDSGSSWVGRLRPGVRSSTAASSTDPLPAYPPLELPATPGATCRSSMSPQRCLLPPREGVKRRAQPLRQARPPQRPRSIL